MTGAAREKDRADFDLERFIDMFDEALTSNDERVINALRSLMMMTILTKSETPQKLSQDKNHGPLRRLYEDLHHINNRLHRVEEEMRYMNKPYAKEESQWPSPDPWGAVGSLVPEQVRAITKLDEDKRNVARAISSINKIPKL